MCKATRFRLGVETTWKTVEAISISFFHFELWGTQSVLDLNDECVCVIKIKGFEPDLAEDWLVISLQKHVVSIS